MSSTSLPTGPNITYSFKMTTPSPPSPPVSLGHTQNSSGRFGSFVDPNNCTCSGCTSYRADQDSEPPGLSNRSPLPPPPTPIQRQNQTMGSPVLNPLTVPTSPVESCSLGPTPTGLGNWRSIVEYLPVRSNGGGISPPENPALRLAQRMNGGGINPPEPPTQRLAQRMESVVPTLRNTHLWEAPPAIRAPPRILPGFPSEQAYTGVEETTFISVKVKEDVLSQLKDYLHVLEKEKALLTAKQELHLALFDQTSYRLAIEQLEKKIHTLSATLAELRE